MKNFVQEGRTVTLTAPYARNAGEGALVGSIFGVAVNDVANGVDGEFLLEGTVDLAKTASQAWTQGALIYWDNTNKVATNVSTSNKLIGTALVAVGSGATETIGRVRLNAAFIS